MSDEGVRELLHAIAFGRLPPASAPRRRQAGAHASRVARKHARWWEARNVVGLCYAPKVRCGRVEDLAVQILVRAKRAKGHVPAHERIPEDISLEELGMRGRLPTDVREVRTPRLETLVSDMRPTLPGFNIGHRGSGSGTLTCAVRSLETGERLGLSCAHVIANSGRAAPGERVLVPSLEQARATGMLENALFGRLVTVMPLSVDFDKASTNVDAATVRPDMPEALDNQMALLGVRPGGVRADAPIGLPVRKVGFASEVTFGTILARHTILALPYPDASGRSRLVWFTDLLGITPFTQPGDSGALVLDLQGDAVGLHMGSADGMSICAPIQRVLDSVRCTLDTGAPPVA
ncbi:MAG: hypothetical protein ACJ8AT_06115 [Hyalangium sp.]|uniref:hypothetical protein n=1 Tax=Hyalangium sp. TaxID=2028555 RepID=UPI00389AD2A4